MSTFVFSKSVVRSVQVALVALTLAVGGWVYIHPLVHLHVVADQGGHVSTPAVAEGHEGDFGG